MISNLHFMLKWCTVTSSIIRLSSIYIWNQITCFNIQKVFASLFKGSTDIFLKVSQYFGYNTIQKVCVCCATVLFDFYNNKKKRLWFIPNLHVTTLIKFAQTMQIFLNLILYFLTLIILFLLIRVQPYKILR